tara:strand:+ start:77 stop:781 length:705 start_codon:yes stop_codon:yes gene_type:complete
MTTAATVNAAKLAEVLALESAEVRELTKEGVFPEVSAGNYNLGESIQAYINHLRGSADIRELNEQLLRERVEKTRAEKERIKRANRVAKAPPVAADSEASLTMLAKISGTDKGDAKSSLVEARIPSKRGARNADLYPLLPAMKVLINRKAEARTVQQSIIDRNTEDARLKRIQAEKLEGNFAPVEDLAAMQAELLDGVAAIIRTSALSDERKEDIFTAINDHNAEWLKLYESGD